MKESARPSCAESTRHRSQRWRWRSLAAEGSARPSALECADQSVDQVLDLLAPRRNGLSVAGTVEEQGVLLSGGEFADLTEVVRLRVLDLFVRAVGAEDACVPQYSKCVGLSGTVTPTSVSPA